MRLLFVIPDMYMGGAGKQLALTAHGLLSKGNEIFLYTYLGNNLEHKLDEKITYIPESHPRKSRLGSLVTTPLHIRRVVKKIRPDIVIGWRAHAGGLSTLGCLGLPVKVIFSERNDPYIETTITLKFLTKICCFADGGVFQTPKIRDFYKGLKKSVICVNILDPKISIQDIIPILERKKEIAWVGRMVNSHKRMDIALKAFKIVHEQFPEYIMTMWGNGGDLESAKQMAEDLGLANYVYFPGSTDNVIDVLRKSRSFMLTSDYEGLPNVVIESFVAGTPVVATDCNSGGVRMLIEDGKNGYYAPRGDYKTIAKKMISILSDDKLSMLFIEKSRNKLREFDNNTVVNKWQDFLGSVVNNLAE